MLLNVFVNDGGDHIRVSPYGKTTVGRIASMDWRKKFFVPHLGEFSSSRCFANWLVCGNEDARHNVRFKVDKTIKGYRTLMLYAKYHQLCSLKKTLANEPTNLVFVAYKQHKSGIKEGTGYRENPVEVKDFIEYILANKDTTKYDWDKNYPGLLGMIDSLVKEILKDNVHVVKAKQEEVAVPVNEEIKETELEEV